MNDKITIKGIWKTREVYIDERALKPNRSQAIYNHSPDGFNWGYGGSGPAQLALALLLEFTSEENATRYYQKFKWDVIAKLPKKDFEIPVSDVTGWIVENIKNGETQGV